MPAQIFQSRSRGRRAAVRIASVIPAAVLTAGLLIVIAAALAPSGRSLELPPFVAIVLPTVAPSPTPASSPATPEPAAAPLVGANATVASAASGFGQPTANAPATTPAAGTAPATPTPAAAQATLPPAAPTAPPTPRGQAPATFPGRTPPPR